MEESEVKLKSLLNQIDALEKEFLKSSETIMNAGDCSIHKFDYFALSVINRAISLNKGFKLLIETKNTLSAVSLLRLQLDNLIRYNAFLVSENPLEFINHILDNKPINEYSENKQNFHDNFLAKQLDSRFENSYKLYKHLCNYIHYGYAHVDYIFREKEIKTENSTHKVVIGDSNNFCFKAKIDYTENVLILSINLIKLMNIWAKDKDNYFK